MPAPRNSTLIDDFNRSSLGAGWTTVSSIGLKIDLSSYITSNDSAAGSDCIAAYNGSTYGGENVDAWCQLAIYGPSGAWVGISILSDLTINTQDGYCYLLETNGTNRCRMWRMDNGVYTQLGSTYTAWTVAVNDYFWIEKRGSSLAAYNSTDGINWTNTASATDATYTGPFYIGCDIHFDSGAFGSAQDNLKGGTVNLGYPIWLLKA